jgi:hypothetical protein
LQLILARSTFIFTYSWPKNALFASLNVFVFKPLQLPIFGNTLKARALPQQKTEAWIATQALNRMTLLGMPSSVKIS